MRFGLVSLLLAAVAQDNGAEKLFRKMGDKIDKAKTIQVAFEATIEQGPFGGKMKGTLSVGEGDKLRLEASGEFGGKKGQITMVSDGTKMKTVEGEEGKLKDRGEQDTPKNLGKSVKYAVKTVGVAAGIFIGMRNSSDGKDEPKIEDVISVAEFKLGAKEKVGGRQAQVLECKATIAEGGGKKMPAEVRVWIDVETHLPLKHVLTAEE